MARSHIVMRYRRRLCAAVLACSMACGGSHGSPTVPTSTPVSQPAPTPAAAATPATPSPYAVSGIVTEVNGAPLAGVSVRTTPGGPSTTTDAAGTFSLTGVTQDILVFEKNGYEWNAWNKPAGGTSSGPLAMTIKLQPIFNLTMDAGVMSLISNDDLTYSSALENSFWDGTYFCGPCKEIGLQPALLTGARLRLTWNGPAPLSLWAGEYYSAPSAHAEGTSQQSELVLDVPPGRLDTVLVGAAFRDGLPVVLSQTVSFQLTVEPRP